MSKKTNETVPGEAPVAAPITEEEISEKVRAGLSREQALQVLTANRAHAATLEN